MIMCGVMRAGGHLSDDDLRFLVPPQRAHARQRLDLLVRDKQGLRHYTRHGTAGVDY